MLPITYQNKTRIPGKKEEVSGLLIRSSRLYHLGKNYLKVGFGGTV